MRESTFIGTMVKSKFDPKYQVLGSEWGSGFGHQVHAQTGTVSGWKTTTVIATHLETNQTIYPIRNME